VTGPVSRYLDGNDFANALLSGIHRVISDQEDLNRINVFPVADGDTGTNLSLSLGAVIDLLDGPGEKHLGSLLASIADALLDGARGNSGAILAQFFQGVSDSAGDLTRFTTYTFSNAMSQGKEYAHDALSNPREGTILSVITAYADAIAESVAHAADDGFPALLDGTLPDVEEALARTTSQLDALRKAGVVDAGAKGFVDLVRGMHEYVTAGRIAPKPDLSLLYDSESVSPTVGTADGYAYRYCTECIVTGTSIDRRKLREALTELGDSLVLAGTKRKAKVHIHVNDPADVFETGRKFGAVSAEKVDDLHRQARSSHEPGRHFAVITDSAADIADVDMERLDIHMVPCRIQFGSRGYLDKVTITTEEFYRELATNPAHPTTSQPAPGDFRRQFQFLASHFPDVISINLTGAASGTLEAARSAASRIDAAGRVHVINSLNASLGQGLLAVVAAECAAAGMSIDAALARVRKLIPETRTFGLLRDLSYAVRGGRIPKWAGVLTRFLRLTPIIRTTGDGRVGLSGFFFGSRHRIRRFCRHVARRTELEGPLRVAVGHAACPEDAELLAARLRERLGNVERLSITDLGTALGVHGGPGALIVAFQPYTEPDAGAGQESAS
jgi:DegV family protein with EDD domain